MFKISVISDFKIPRRERDLQITIMNATTDY